jgi:cell division protein ZapA
MASIKINILDDEFQIRSNEDDSHILKCSEFVDHKMREFKKATGINSPQKLAVLTALNLADELLKLKERYKNDIHSLDKEVKNLFLNLDKE